MDLGNQVIVDILSERKRQNDKWGIQDHNVIEWIAILTEEVGEASKEAVDFHFGTPLDNGFSNIQKQKLRDYRKEMIQVAAVAMQAVESLDRQTNSIYRNK
jgi:hypothetical protein